MSLQVNESGGHVRVQSVTSTDEALTTLSERLDRIENAIAPLIQTLKKIPQMALAKPIDVADADFEISTPTLPPDLKPPLSQRELSERLGQRYSYYLKKHRVKGKEHFEAWSQSLDPDGIAWTFEEPRRHRGKASTQTLKFYPKP